MNTELAMFGAGCFWSPEYYFAQIPGVKKVTSGYSGGHTLNPTYRDVCRGDTGHAEVVKVEFDPETVTYEQLLDVFWSIHDPTQKDRQGPDRGTEYRTAVFYCNENQHVLAVKSMAEEQVTVDRPIVTEIVPASTFYPAESFHERYIERTGWACHPRRRPYKKLSQTQ